MYILESQAYLVCYQWNPGTTKGGNCAWGMAKSKDLVTWEDCKVTIWNGTSYDSPGVFSGSIASRVVAVKRLYTCAIPAYPPWQSTGLSRTSTDEKHNQSPTRQTWVKHRNNPLLAVPLKEATATGWRDPFVIQSQSLLKLLNVRQDKNYIMLA
ncbi:uncharacterized protein G6M90_00g107190 [Metarhizium brunneum]|uniref:Glycosyl hydrolase family 32 N-terminal domain-containing protein n=1 Tax=Metarhizium brunneum TaxID=500148 RepID=A0A7D5V552_9HYPO|nr:hypothetical protein G6M90_00g107190 [Metarhizium brunneum]